MMAGNVHREQPRLRIAAPVALPNSDIWRPQLS